MPDSPPATSSSSPGWLSILFVAGPILLFALALSSWVAADYLSDYPEDVEAEYVGRQSCIECHAQEHRDWHGSHHDLAMDVATEETVLADFNDATFEHHGISSRMFRRDDKFFVETEGPDGKLGVFEVKYTLGVEPLQQYMVEFDRGETVAENEVARLQVLRLSWDTEKKEWFYLPPPDVDDKLAPTDDLHWTGVAQRWNNMCSDCHSTNLQRNYNVSERTYHTTWSEIDVSCEACHGPGSLHVEMAESFSFFWDRKLGYGLAKLKDESNRPQIETCARCHSRRRIVSPDTTPGEPFHDYHLEEQLDPLTYYCDGQIKDEVYVYGSFIQSKMYHKNVRCTDCHDPHTTKVKFEGENKLCTSCHQHPAAVYDSPRHHHHPVGSVGSKCIECHMPHRRYMEVDPRRDHSLRSPRPDLSVKHQVPNACSGCHLDEATLDPEKRAKFQDYQDWLTAAERGDKTVRAALDEVDRWAAEHAAKWYPPPPVEQPDPLAELAAALESAWNRDPQARAPLLELAADATQSPMARASAFRQLLQLEPDDEIARAALQTLDDPAPTVRVAAIATLEPRAIQLRLQWDALRQQVRQLKRRHAELLPGAIANPGGNILRELTQFQEQTETEANQVRARLERLLDPVAGLLDDPVRAVRTEAARMLTRNHSLLGEAAREKYEPAWEELLAGINADRDRGGAHLAIGVLHEARADDFLAYAENEATVRPVARQWKKAAAAYRTAISVEPMATGPRTNLATTLEKLADVAQRAGDPQQAERLLAEAKRLRRDELPYLARDAKLAPENGPVQYRYGLALYLDGQAEAAEQVLRRATELEPEAYDFQRAFTLLLQQRGKIDAAAEAAKRLLEIAPGSQEARRILEDLNTTRE